MTDIVDVPIEACARSLAIHAAAEFAKSIRRGERNDAWYDLWSALAILWPEVGFLPPKDTAP